jgi:hypothetical protein
MDWMRQLTYPPTGACNHRFDWKAAASGNIRDTGIFTDRAGSRHRTGIRAMGIVRNEVDPARNRRFSGRFKAKGPS